MNESQVINQFLIPWKNGYIIYDEYNNTVQYFSDNQKKLNVIKIVKQRLKVNKREDFSPHCLTVFPHNHCNLYCKYCYSNGGKSRKLKIIDPEVVGIAASMIIQNSKKKGNQLILGFHGGCEPLINFEIIKQCIQKIDQICLKADVNLILHITTNGVISQKIAKESSKLFNSITISCDGPSFIHDVNRKTINGKPTLDIVQRTGQIFLKEMKYPQYLRVRSTIVRSSIFQMEEIVKYFGENWRGLRYLQVEPIYDRGRGGSKIEPDQFVIRFIKSRRLVAKFGINLIYAGSRPTEIHDRFCPIKQENMTVTPDGYLTSCFCITEHKTNQDDRFLYGFFQKENNKFLVNQDRLHSIQETLKEDIIRCKNCFNRNHCSRGCPEVCPLEPYYHDAAEKYDCRIQRWIGFALLLEKAGIYLSDDDLARISELFPKIS